MEDKLKKILVLLFLFLISLGCFHININTNNENNYSQIEILLADFSKKITAYYTNQNQPIPTNFDENEFIKTIEKIYPDKNKIELIKNKYKIKARAIGQDYSIVLCNTDTNSKLMEDFSCTLNKVDIRYWDKEGRHFCEFEEKWQKYCE